MRTENQKPTEVEISKELLEIKFLRYLQEVLEDIDAAFKDYYSNGGESKKLNEAERFFEEETGKVKKEKESEHTTQLIPSRFTGWLKTCGWTDIKFSNRELLILVVVLFDASARIDKELQHYFEQLINEEKLEEYSKIKQIVNNIPAVLGSLQQQIIENDHTVGLKTPGSKDASFLKDLLLELEIKTTKDFFEKFNTDMKKKDEDFVKNLMGNDFLPKEPSEVEQWLKDNEYVDTHSNEKEKDIIKSLLSIYAHCQVYTKEKTLDDEDYTHAKAIQQLIKNNLKKILTFYPPVGEEFSSKKIMENIKNILGKFDSKLLTDIIQPLLDELAKIDQELAEKTKQEMKLTSPDETYTKLEETGVSNYSGSIRLFPAPNSNTKVDSSAAEKALAEENNQGKYDDWNQLEEAPTSDTPTP